MIIAIQQIVIEWMQGGSIERRVKHEIGQARDRVKHEIGSSTS